jgi:hypothetical protein
MGDSPVEGKAADTKGNLEILAGVVRRRRRERAEGEIAPARLGATRERQGTYALPIQVGGETRASS